MKDFPDIITRDQIDRAYIESLFALGSEAPPEAVKFHTERMEYCLWQLKRIGVHTRTLKEMANV